MMPGRVINVLVNVGDEVAHQQGLVVIEAMKMENEIEIAQGRQGHRGQSDAGPDRRKGRACWR